MAPTQLRVSARHGRFLLGFASAVDNVGTAPLLVEGQRDGGEQTMRAWQLVGTRRHPVRSVLRYVKSPGHAHWHLLGFDRYSLRRAGRPVGRDAKTGFCLTDQFDARREMLPGEPEQAVWTRECGRGQPQLLRIRQGLSVGFRDVYEPFLEGQHVDVTALPPGRYVLVHTVNPHRALRESDYGNNSASALIELELARVGARPRVRLLRLCEDSATCPPP